MRNSAAPAGVVLAVSRAAASYKTKTRKEKLSVKSLVLSVFNDHYHIHEYFVNMNGVCKSESPLVQSNGVETKAFAQARVRL